MASDSSSPAPAAADPGPFSPESRVEIWDLWSRLYAAVERLPLENAARSELADAVGDLSDLIGDAVGSAGSLDPVA